MAPAFRAKMVEELEEGIHERQHEAAGAAQAGSKSRTMRVDDL